MHTLTLARKDWMILFRSPLAYIVLGCFLFISGYFFVSLVGQFQLFSLQVMQNPGVENFTPQEWVIRPFLQNAGVILLFFIPLLTMRSFSEEKRMGTFELLLSYPVQEYQIVLGKLLAVGGFLTLALILSGVGPSFLFLYAQPELLPTLTGYLGLLLLGLSFASIGIFISSLTENQIVSATLSFGALLLLWLLSWVKELVPGFYKPVVEALSLLSHFDSFTKGVLSVPDLTYYLTFILAFVGLTMLSLENQRWRA
ncbi:ABC transporter permease [Desulfovulcanus sp.]